MQRNDRVVRARALIAAGQEYLQLKREAGRCAIMATYYAERAHAAIYAARRVLRGGGAQSPRSL